MIDIVTIFAMIGVFVVGLFAITFCIFLLGMFIELIFFAGWLGYKITKFIVKFVTRRFRNEKSDAVHESLSCPKCGTMVVQCDEAGVEALNRLAEDKAREMRGT